MCHEDILNNETGHKCAIKQQKEESKWTLCSP